MPQIGAHEKVLPGLSVTGAALAVQPGCHYLSYNLARLLRALDPPRLAAAIW